MVEGCLYIVQAVKEWARWAVVVRSEEREVCSACRVNVDWLDRQGMSFNYGGGPGTRRVGLLAGTAVVPSVYVITQLSASPLDCRQQVRISLECPAGSPDVLGYRRLSRFLTVVLSQSAEIRTGSNFWPTLAYHHGRHGTPGIFPYPPNMMQDF